MIVDFALEAERTRGLSSAQAIYEALSAEIPPDFDDHPGGALLAGIPLAFGSGIGSELRRPLGIAMVGGLLPQPASDALHDSCHLHIFRHVGATLCA